MGSIDLSFNQVFPLTKILATPLLYCALKLVLIFYSTMYCILYCDECQLKIYCMYTYVISLFLTPFYSYFVHFYYALKMFKVELLNLYTVQHFVQASTSMFWKMICFQYNYETLLNKQPYSVFQILINSKTNFLLKCSNAL